MTTSFVSIERLFFTVSQNQQYRHCAFRKRLISVIDKIVKEELQRRSVVVSQGQFEVIHRFLLLIRMK
jgi:hypothetical protein